MPVTSPDFTRLLPLIPETLRNASGEVFYSGRNAFGKESSVYILGLNPGSDSADASLNTVSDSVRQTMHVHPPSFSRYVDERWGKGTGQYSPMQTRMQHLARQVGLNLRDVPASNLVFKRSVGVEALKSELSKLADLCWPLHQEIIASQRVRVVICLGRDAFEYVAGKLGANQSHPGFAEKNRRGWQSICVKNRNGLYVVKLSHPGRAAWTSASSDPSEFVSAILKEAVSYPEREH